MNQPVRIRTLKIVRLICNTSTNHGSLKVQMMCSLFSQGQYLPQINRKRGQPNAKYGVLDIFIIRSRVFGAIVNDITIYCTEITRGFYLQTEAKHNPERQVTAAPWTIDDLLTKDKDQTRQWMIHYSVTIVNYINGVPT